jgi:hypothetical protein
MPGTNAPAASRAKYESTRVSPPQVHRLQTGIPCATVLRFPSCSPRRSGFLAAVTGAMRKHRRRLDSSVEESEPHDFAVRKKQRSSNAPLPSIASRVPRFVTIGRNVPLAGPGWREDVSVICPTAQRENFSREDWTGGIAVRRLKKFEYWRT